MKWVFYVIVFIYMAYRAVYGAKLVNDISIANLDYGNETYFKAGTRKAIECKGSVRNQRLEWLDPHGRVVKRVPTSRVTTQEHIASVNGGRSSAAALLLVFSELMVKDSGVYRCRSGPKVEEVSLCVMTPPEFVNTATEVAVEVGRSITLSCQARGDPEPNLAWIKDFNEITESNNTAKHRVNTKYNSQGFESLLTVTDLEPEDAGVYQCMAVQHTPLGSCENVAVQNITLQVSYAPNFENANDTKAVYGNNNEVVDMICSANGYPAPTYRWFKSISDDTLAEFDKKQITFSEDENKAVLQVNATPLTFGKTFKCLATNTLGEAEKYFTLFKIQAPKKPDTIKFELATDSVIEFSVSWLKLEFPVTAFLIQYLNTKKKPTEKEWKKATQVYKEMNDDLVVFAFEVSLDNLEEDSSYWVRMKASNEAGQSPWSDPVFATTDIKPETEPDPEPEELDADTEKSQDKPVDTDSSNGTFYGIFFAGGIAVAAVLYMFAIRLV